MAENTEITENNDYINWGFGKRVPKTKENEFGWENVELDDIPTDKPIVLCFGGNGTISNRFANFLAKLSNRLLGVTSENNFVDTFSFRYGANQQTIFGKMDDQDIEELAKAIFVPRVTDENGKRLPLEKTCMNLRDVNILIHCYGQDVINRTITHLANTMQHELGYQEKEIRTALKQIFVVGYSPLTNSNNLYSSFFVKSLNDEMLNFTNKKDPFTSDEEYIGVGEFVTNNNTLDLFTDSILGVKGRLATPALFEHGNLNYLLRTLDWFNENPRAETISRIMALALALGVTTSKTQHIQNKFIPLPDVQEIKTLLEPEVEKAKKTAFEQEDEKLWHRYKEQGVPFADVLKYAGISEKDLLNGKMHEFDKIAKKILESKYCGIDYSKNPCFQNLGIFNSSFIFKSKAGMADSIIDVADDKMIDIGTAEYNFLIARNIARCILLPDGTYEEFRRENSHVDNKTWLENGVLSAKLRFILTDNSVVLYLDSENKKMKVEVGKSFEDREYQSAEDFIWSLKPSITEPFTLTKEQTRAILNIAHAQNIAFEDITLDENLSFNQTIIEKEMATDKNEQTLLKENSENKAQQQADVINHFSKQKTEKKEIKLKSSTENEVSIKT